jgi:TonB family protein
VSSVTRKIESAAPEPAERRTAATAKKAKLSVFVVTADDSLWPQIGTLPSPHLMLKQVDALAELFTATAEGQGAIVLWDARGETDRAAALSRVQLHSPRFAVVALDDADNAHVWTHAIAARQVVAHVAVPILAHSLNPVLESAEEEVAARTALLGDGNDAAPAAAGRAVPGMRVGAARKFPSAAAGIVAALLIGGAAAYLVLRQGDAPLKSPPATKLPAVPAANDPALARTPAASGQPAAPEPATPTAAGDEQIDLLIEKAQRAMTERHFIDPADGSALSFYRSALLLDPDNGEARQGLQRLAEILFARVQSALDERKIDVALQSLESARSINPADGRLAALDERIAALRAEFGPAQILAAISAQNFDRAGQLIEDAARAKLLSNAKLSQLREELRRRHEESDITNLSNLIDTRLQQDKVISPRNDSAAYYLTLARAAGASAASLQAQSQEINKRLAATLHGAIEQRRFADADRLIADMRTDGVPSATIAAFQHDLAAARSPQSAAAPEPAQFIDADAVRAQIMEQARASLDPPQAPTAEPPEVGEASLTRVRGIDIDYPPGALRKNIEGWVELSYVVTADGKVTRIAVVDSSPRGTFDAAAANALGRTRYKPPLQNGKPTAVTTKVRIAFQMAK